MGNSSKKKYNYDIALGETYGNWRVLKDLESKVSGTDRRQEKMECQCLLCGRIMKVSKRTLLNPNSERSCNYCMNRKNNSYEVSGDSCIGYSSKNEPFIIDSAFLTECQNHCWFIVKDGYFKATYRDETGRKLYIKQSNAVWEHYNGELGEEYIIDHINGVVYDNRIENLRKLTSQENCWNKKIISRNTSGVTGVSYNKRDSLWIAKIGHKSKVYKLGRFVNFEDAVIARLVAEKEYFGDLSRQKHLFEKYGI